MIERLSKSKYHFQIQINDDGQIETLKKQDSTTKI